MLIAIDRFIRAQQRRLVAVLAVAALACGLVAAHSAMRADHMGMGVAMCLAIAEVAVLAVTAGLLDRRRRWMASQRPVLVLRPSLCLRRPRPVARSRAGPPVLQVFRF